MDLKDSIRNRQARIGIIGLGYVGLPLAVEFARAGFDVLSMANNHIVDAGHAAMLENRARLRAQGVKTCGAGENLDDARKPAIIEAGGLKIAFLAYGTT